MAESSINPIPINCGYHNVLVYLSRYFSTPTRPPGLFPDDVNNFSFEILPRTFPTSMPRPRTFDTQLSPRLRQGIRLNIWTSGQNAALSVLFDHSFPHALIFGWSSASQFFQFIWADDLVPCPACCPGMYVKVIWAIPSYPPVEFFATLFFLHKI